MLIAIEKKFINDDSCVYLGVVRQFITPNKMNISVIISILFLLFSCNGKNTKFVEKDDTLKDTLKTISTNKIKTESSKVEDLQNEVMLETDILFNGKLNRYFSLNQFQKVFGKTDSIKLMSEEAPCTYIFENEDGSKDLDDKYLYKDGSRFENTKQKVAVDEFRFTKNNFILFKGKKLNSITTISELRILFPNATKNIGILDVDEEGELQVIQLREDGNNISDGHIKIFVKNGKLYFMHWWLPC